jgi:hypothetical protein
MKRGISIIEVMVFIVSTLIAVLGASGYRYFAIMDIRRSDSEISAGRVAEQLCQSWKGIGGGASNYDPLSDPGIGLTIENDTNSLAPEAPLGFTLLTNGGHYKVSSNSRAYYATMSYHTTNSASGNLDTLNVTINWPANEKSTGNDAAMRSLSLSDLLITH